MEFDPNNMEPWIIHWLPLMEHKMDARLVLMLKLRHGMIDNIKHTYKSMGLLAENRCNSKFRKNDYLSGSRAKDLYDKATRNLGHYVGRYQDSLEE